MRRSFVSQNPTIARINITPIIGVALVLVLILLVTAPMLCLLDLGITLPEAQARGSEDEHRLSVTLGKSGELAIDDVLIPRENLVAILNARLTEENRGDALVVVRADAMVPHEDVHSILQEVREAGARRVAIATRQGEMADQ